MTTLKLLLRQLLRLRAILISILLIIAVVNDISDYGSVLLSYVV